MRFFRISVLLLSLPCAVHAGENLLSDGSLATGPFPPWIPVPLTLAYSSVADDGHAAPAAEITTSVSGPSGQGLYQCISTTAGAAYRLAAYVKRVDANTTTISGIGLAAAFYTGSSCSGSILGLGSAVADPDTLTLDTWTALQSGVVTAPPGTVSALVGLGANAANTAAYTFRVDSASFVLDEVVFFDGFEK